MITERLNPRTVADLNMENAVLQVDTPEQMRDAIKQLSSNPEQLSQLVENGKAVIKSNLWDARAEQMLSKFTELLAQPSAR